MDLAKKMHDWRALARATNAWYVGLDILNTVCLRLRWKFGFGLPVRTRSADTTPFFIRPGTTDWSTYKITFLSDEYGFVRDSVPTPRSVVDLGANIGDSTRYFADIYPDATIIAIEPDAGNFEMCRKNVERTVPSGRVACKQCFVGAQAGEAGIDRSQGEWAYAMDRSGAAAEQIPVITMSDLMREFNLAEVDLLKCDIEGAEEELFRDCSAWISRVRHLAIETCPPYSITRLEKDLAHAGASFVKLHHTAPDGFHELALFRRQDVAA